MSTPADRIHPYHEHDGRSDDAEAAYDHDGHSIGWEARLGQGRLQGVLWSRAQNLEPGAARGALPHGGPATHSAPGQIYRTQKVCSTPFMPCPPILHQQVSNPNPPGYAEGKGTTPTQILLSGHLTSQDISPSLHTKDQDLVSCGSTLLTVLAWGLWNSCTHVPEGSLPPTEREYGSTWMSESAKAWFGPTESRSVFKTSTLVGAG